MAVFPSPESETEAPCWAAPVAAVPTSFASWLQTPLDRVNNHAAPAPLLSAIPPKMAVFPSSESETELPWRGGAGPNRTLKNSEFAKQNVGSSKVTLA